MLLGYKLGYLDKMIENNRFTNVSNIFPKLYYIKIIINFSQNKENHTSIKTYHVLNEISANMDLLLKSTKDTCTVNDKWHDNCIKVIK